MGFSIYGDQFTGVVKVPCVKRTGKASLFSTSQGGNLSTSVPTNIQESAKLAVCVTSKQQRLPCLIGCEVSVIVW